MRLFKMSLAPQMAIATLLGIVCGLFFGDLCDVFAPWSLAYIMLLKITAIPYLIGAIIHGVGQLSSTQAKQILKRGIIFIGIAWAINVGVIYLINYGFPKAAGSHVTGYVSTEVSHLNFAELLIPDNIFYDLSNNIVPAIVIFSLLIGIALMQLKEKQTLMYSFGNLVDALTRITSWIARITPFGTFIILANQVGTIHLSTVKQVSTYIILYILGVGLVVFWIFPRVTRMLTSVPSYRWLQQMFPILLLAYTTNMVIVCLPYIIELLKKETQLLDPMDEKAQNQIQGTVSVVFNLPLGSLFITVFIFFISIFYSFPLGIGDQFELFVTAFLTSLGAVGLGSWINSLTFILDSLGLPNEAVNIYLTTLPFTSGFQSMLSSIEVASISLFITLSCRRMLILKWKRIIREGLFTIIPVLLIFGGIRAFDPLPRIHNEIKSIYELKICSSIPVTVHKTIPEGLSKGSTKETLDRILQMQVLRVGYNPHVSPFCFFNFDGDLVGYDIAFAYELAFDLGCRLEFIPMSYSHMVEELDAGLYDIAMSSVSINEEKLKDLSFTSPYLSSRLAFVVQEGNRKSFETMDRIRQDASLSIAVLKGSSFEIVAKEVFPGNQLILLASYEDYTQCSGKVALLWEERKAISWIVFHRNYRLVFPDPLLGNDSIGYAIAGNSVRFQNYLDQWLELKKGQGYVDRQYDLWIKGKTEIVAPQEVRWSIVRDVLHWVP